MHTISRTEFCRYGKTIGKTYKVYYFRKENDAHQVMFIDSSAKPV